jgi:predicted nucleotidyltransferase
MQTGKIEANLLHLNEGFMLPYIDDLVARKLAGTEHSTLEDADVDFHRSEYERLYHALEEAQARSALPEDPTCKDALNELLMSIRLAN